MGDVTGDIIARRHKPMIDIEKIREGVASCCRIMRKEGELRRFTPESDAEEILQFLADEGMGWAEELEPLNCPEIADTPLSKAIAEVAVEQFAYYSTPRKDIKLIKFKPLKDLC